MEDLISEFINNIYENISVSKKEEIKYVNEEMESIKEDLVETIKTISDKDIRENVLKEIRRLKENPNNAKSFMDSNGKVNVTKLKAVVSTAKTNAEKIKFESNKITNSKETLNQEKQFVNNTSEINKEEYIEFIKKEFEGTDVDKWNEKKKADFYETMYQIDEKIELYKSLIKKGFSKEEAYSELNLPESSRELFEQKLFLNGIREKIEEEKNNPNPTEEDRKNIEELEESEKAAVDSVTNVYDKMYIKNMLNGYFQNKNINDFDEYCSEAEISEEDKRKLETVLKKVKDRNADISEVIEELYGSQENKETSEEHASSGESALDSINQMR